MADKVEKLDTKLIRELANILKDADLGEIEVEQGDLRIRVSRPDPAPMMVSAPVSSAPAAAAPTAAAAPAVLTAPAAAADAGAHAGAVKSPMVGTAYLAPEPGAADFIKEGDTVKEGQTLLLVEAMKTFNPVTAHVSGTVKEIIVKDAQPVEYGEPLVIIE